MNKPTKTLSTLFLLTACNQNVYDSIYKNIIQQALQSHEKPRVVFAQRNTAIETLRHLCNGQLSSFERPLRGRQALRQQ